MHIDPSVNHIALAALLAVFVQFSCQPRADEGRGSPEDFPLRYSLGTIDPRFGIERERFLTLAREAEAVWEVKRGMPLFEYDPTSDFTVSLVFDERQQRTLEARKAKEDLTEREYSIQSMMRDYNAAQREHHRLKERYDSDLASFNGRLERYNARVAEWNRKGGASPHIVADLKDEELAINRARRELETATTQLNTSAFRLNSTAEKINALADEFNVHVGLFNGRFVESREFEQGEYDGKGIVIYQFTEEADLRIALTHEFGHALGFGHVDTPEAIMHRRLGQQPMDAPTLMPDDLELLRRKFGDP